MEAGSALPKASATYVSQPIPEPATCDARWQSVIGRLSEQVSLYNFESIAGKTYYYRVPITVQGASEGGAVSIDLQAVSEDEGRFLVSEAARSISKVK